VFGAAFVSQGGTAISATIGAFSKEEVYGIDSGATINANTQGENYTEEDNGGFQVVESSGTAFDATVTDFSVQTIAPGGTAIGTVVRLSAPESNPIGSEIDDYGTVVSAVLDSGGDESVFGIDSGTTASGQNSRQEIVSGGMAISATFNSGATQSVYDDLSLARHTTINNGASAVVESSGTMLYATVNPGGILYVSSGGTANSEMISGGAGETVFANGDDTLATIFVLGNQLLSGGTASYTIISGGAQTIDSGGTAIATTISSGQIEVSAGGTTISTIISSRSIPAA
jgi:autotransporter passenger strand-loop-strand repeat protein